MQNIAGVLVVFALALQAIGVYAYLHAGSVISLCMSLFFGIWLEGAGVLLFQGKRVGGWAGLAGLALLIVTFGVRYAAQGKTLSLALAIVSCALAAWLLRKLISSNGDRSI